MRYLSPLVWRKLNSPDVGCLLFLSSHISAIEKNDHMFYSIRIKMSIKTNYGQTECNYLCNTST